MPESKQQIRQRLRLLRQELAPTEVEAMSQAIIRRCIKSIEWSKITAIHCFLPIPKRNEVNTWSLLEYVWNNYPAIKTYVPIWDETDVMSSAQVDSSTGFNTSNRVDIPQPDVIVPAPSNLKFDLIIIPLIGFDTHGQRLGYGYGHYDRWLPTQPTAQKFGLAFELGFIPKSLPADRWDIPLDAIITEDKIYRHD